MPLFDFLLHPLGSVTPWTRPGMPDELHLSWFGLTDGLYSVDCGLARLFQYSEEMCVELSQQFPHFDSSDWVDYQVIRLYEDILELIPYSLAEVPLDVHRMINSFDGYRSWRESLAWVLDRDDDKELDEKYFRASDWLACRKLDCGYLVDGPNVWIWRFQNHMFWLWDNDDRVTDGVQRWTAHTGQIAMPVDSFLSEIKSFHHRLMASMQDRVNEVVSGNPFSGVIIDMPALVQEQREREKSLSFALSQPLVETDWDTVIKANNYLRNA